MKHKAENDYITELLRCAVTKDDPLMPPEALDWEYVFSTTKNHKILSTIYFGLQKLPKDITSSVPHFDDYLLAYKKELVKDANRSYELSTLTKEFEKAGIDYVLLKGSASKRLYPDTAMRAMSDIDIFYRGVNVSKVNDIFLNHKYTIFKEEPKETSYIKESISVKFEMQTSMIDEGYDKWFNYLSDIWDRCVRVKETHEYIMSDEDFYIYHIIHMAKHFKNGGIGLLHLLDFYIIECFIDKKIKTHADCILKDLGLYVFKENIQKLVDYRFKKITPNSDELYTVNLIEEYIFSNGAFGMKTQNEINAIVDRNDSHISFRKKIFPPREIFVDYYGSIINNYPILIPFFWLRLTIDRLTRGKKEIAGGMKRLNNISTKQIEKTRELMDLCGL